MNQTKVFYSYEGIPGDEVITWSTVAEKQAALAVILEDGKEILIQEDIRAAQPPQQPQQQQNGVQFDQKDPFRQGSPGQPTQRPPFVPTVVTKPEYFTVAGIKMRRDSNGKMYQFDWVDITGPNVRVVRVDSSTDHLVDVSEIVEQLQWVEIKIDTEDGTDV